MICSVAFGNRSQTSCCMLLKLYAVEAVFKDIVGMYQLVLGSLDTTVPDALLR